MPVTLKAIEGLKETFNAILLQSTYPSLLLENDALNIPKIEFKSYLNQLYHIHKTTSVSHAKGLYVCHYNKLKLTISINIYNCKEGGYVSTKNVSNGIFNCPK